MKKITKPAARPRATLAQVKQLQDHNSDLMALLSDKGDQIASLRNLIEVQAGKLQKAETFMETLQADQQKGLARAGVKSAVDTYKEAQAAEKVAEEALNKAKEAHTIALEKLKEAKRIMTGEFWDTVNPPQMVTVRKDQVKGNERINYGCDFDLASGFPFPYPSIGRMKF